MSLIPLLLSPLAPAPPAGEHAAAWLSPPRSPSATNGNAGTRRPRRRTSGQPATRPPRHSGRRGARPSPAHPLCRRQGAYVVGQRPACRQFLPQLRHLRQRQAVLLATLGVNLVQ